MKIKRQRQLEELETTSESSFPPLSETTSTDSCSQISMSSWTSNDTTRMDMVKTAPTAQQEKAYKTKSRHLKIKKMQSKYQEEEDEDDEFFLGDFDFDDDDEEEEEGDEISDMEFDLDEDYQENSEDYCDY